MLLAFVRPFYQKTLGLWAFILLVGGVLMEARQHVLLGRFFFKSPVAFWILPVALLLFGWIHLNIEVNLLRVSKYQFFHQLGLFPKKDFRSFWAKTILFTHSPLLAYLLFLSYFAWEQHSIYQGISLWFFLIFSLWITYRKIRIFLNHPIKEKAIKRPSVRWTFPRFTWVLLSLKQQRPILLLLVKALGLLVMNGFFFSFQSGNYDFRWLQFGILCVIFLQFPIILEKTESEVQQQAWVLALPLGLRHKLMYQWGSLTLVLFPELFLLAWKGIHFAHPGEFISLGVLLLSFLSALQVVVYAKHSSPRFPNFVAGLFFLLFL